jgi:hypothetical protein
MPSSPTPPSARYRKAARLISGMSVPQRELMMDGDDFEISWPGEPWPVTGSNCKVARSLEAKGCLVEHRPRHYLISRPLGRRVCTLLGREATDGTE